MACVTPPILQLRADIFRFDILIAPLIIVDGYDAVADADIISLSLLLLRYATYAADFRLITHALTPSATCHKIHTLYFALMPFDTILPPQRHTSPFTQRAVVCAVATAPAT